MRLHMTMTEDSTTMQDQPSRPISRPRRLTPDRRTAAAIGCLLLGVFWLTMGGHTYSIDDETYRTADNRFGRFQNEHRVYGREASPCTACGEAVVRIVQAQRATFFCPACQRRPGGRRHRRMAAP
jgi:predicted RNA-binding Zn-ribbon protein involved in translation (DUF1610 family)